MRLLILVLSGLPLLMGMLGTYMHIVKTEPFDPAPLESQVAFGDFRQNEIYLVALLAVQCAKLPVLLWVLDHFQIDLEAILAFSIREYINCHFNRKPLGRLIDYVQTIVRKSVIVQKYHLLPSLNLLKTEPEANDVINLVDVLTSGQFFIDTEVILAAFNYPRLLIRIMDTRSDDVKLYVNVPGKLLTETDVTILCQCIQFGDLGIIRRCIDFGADPNAPSQGPKYPLSLASHDLKICFYLHFTAGASLVYATPKIRQVFQVIYPLYLQLLCGQTDDQSFLHEFPLEIMLVSIMHFVFQLLFVDNAVLT